MMEFNEFKKKVCNFYRQNSELGYVVDFAPSWSVFVIEAEFKDGDGVKVVFIPIIPVKAKKVSLWKILKTFLL